MPLGPKPDNPPPFYFGWVMLGVASMATVATSPGQTFIVGLFNEPIRQSTGLSATNISLAYLLATAAAALPLTAVGKASDRFGTRRTIGVVATGLALTCFLMPLAASFWTVLIGFFLLRFLGQGSLSVLSGHTVALWFDRRLGTVEAVRSASMSAAIVLLPLPVAALIGQYGWRFTYPMLGVLVLVLTLPAVLLFFRNGPHEVGQRLDGGPAAPTERDTHGPHGPGRTRPDKTSPGKTSRGDDAPALTLLEAIGTRAFWTIVGVGVCNGLIGTAMIFHMQGFIEASGFAPADAKTIAAAALAPWGIVSALGVPVFGVLVDRIGPRWLLVGSPLLLLACLGIFGVGLTTGARWAFPAAMAVFGASQALAVAAGRPTIARWFGRAHHGAIQGFSSTLGVIGTACGPLMLAAAVDYAGGFGVGLIGFAILSLPLVPTALTLAPPRRRARPDRDGAT